MNKLWDALLMGRKPRHTPPAGEWTRLLSPITGRVCMFAYFLDCNSAQNWRPLRISECSANWC